MLQYPLLMLQSDPEVWLTAILPHSTGKPKEFKIAKKGGTKWKSTNHMFVMGILRAYKNRNKTQY